MYVSHVQDWTCHRAPTGPPMVERTKPDKSKYKTAVQCCSCGGPCSCLCHSQGQGGAGGGGTTTEEVGRTEAPAESYEGARGRPEKTSSQFIQIRLVTPPQAVTVLLTQIWLSNNLLDPANAAKVCFSLHKQ